MNKVTKINSSGLERPMYCAGSLLFDLPKPEMNSAAQEGIAAAEYLELLLKGKEVPTHASNGVGFDKDMVYFVKPIVDDILKLGVPVSSEQKVDWTTRSGIAVKCKYDVSYELGDVLHIQDLKYGFGVVEPEKNWQLIAYAIGRIINLKKPFKEVALTIIQPRAHHEKGPIRTWKISYEELLVHKEELEKRLDMIAGGLEELATGPVCKYCPAAAAACPAFSRAFHISVDYVISKFFQDDINEMEISYQLDLLARISDILKIKTDSLQQLAVDRIKSGKLVPGYVTENKLGDRTWKHDVSPEGIKALCGIDIVEKVMLSPAKAEKLGVPKELVKNLVERKALGMKLVKKDGNEIGNKIFGNAAPQIKGDK